MNTIDITHVSERTLDAIFAWKSEDSEFDYDTLSASELQDLARAVGADLSLWIADTRAREARSATRPESDTCDYEALILDDQAERYDTE